ncbi:MAG: hypothetical protein AABX84_02485 [Nanoarchaeota archaeon]
METKKQVDEKIKEIKIKISMKEDEVRSLKNRIDYLKRLYKAHKIAMK